MLNDGFGLPFFNQSPSTTQRQDIKIKPLSTEEERGLLPRIGGAALGGLAYVGSSLEKALGGRAVRGALGGKGRELLSIIPFSDALGITDYADRVSGRDLNKQWGFDDGGDGWGNFLGGLATEVLTDPSMYATFGANALTPAGKALQKAGILPSGQRARMGTSIDEVLKGMDSVAQVTAKENLINAFGGAAAGGAEQLAKHSSAPLAGLFGWRPLPFMAPVPVLEGQAGIGALDAVGKIGSGLKGLHHAIESTPVLGTAYHLTGVPFFGGLAAKGADAGYRYGRALLDNSVLGATTHEGQAVASRVSRLLPGMKAADKQQALQWGLQLEQAGVKDGAQLRRWLEGVEKPPPALEGLVAEMQGAAPAQLLQSKQMGVQINPLQDTIQIQGSGPMGELIAQDHILPTEYWPRQWTHPQSQASLGAPSRQPIRPLDGGLMARREAATSGWLEGTEGFNKAARDPILLDPKVTRLAAAQHLRDAGYVPNNALAKNLEDKVDYLRSLNPNFAAGTAAGETLSPFANHPLIDWGRYTDKQNAVRTKAQAAYELMAEQAINPTATGAIVPDKSVSLMQALNKAGLTDDAAGVGASGQMLERLSKRLGAPVAFDDLGKFVVDQKYADELMRILSPFGTPEYINPLMRGFDKLTNMFKTLVTTPFPGFHIRNKGSGIYQNQQVGGWEAVKNTLQGNKFIAGEVIPWANTIPGFEKMTAKEATDALRMEMGSLNVGGHLQGQANEVLGALGGPVRVGSSLDDFLSIMPGRDPKTLGEAIRTYFGGGKVADVPLTSKINPLNTQGVGAAEDLFAPVAGGRIAGDVVEGTNRSALYMTLRKQGYSAEQAAKEVIGAHFDYSGAGLTDFEKTWMRRLVPFYCVPDDCEILTRRGWLRYEDLVEGEDVLSMNNDTGESEWAPCLGKAVFDYDGVMMTLSNRSTEYLFTPDHNWPVIQTGNSPARGKTVSRAIVKGWELRISQHIPRTSSFIGKGSIATPREAAIAAWVVTDGYQRVRPRSPNHQEMLIYQSPGKYLDKIIELLGEGGSVGKPHPDTGVVPVRLVGELRKRISELIPSKESFVKFVCQLDKEAAVACFEAMLEAEGSMCGDYFGGNKRNHFAQKHGPVLDAFQIVAQLVGTVAHRTESGAYVSYERPTKKIGSGSIGTCWHKGKVWCPQTKHGTWLMRRHGYVIWTGNSFARFNAPFTAGQLTTNSGGLAGTYAKGALDARQDNSQFLPPFLGSGLAVPTGPEDEKGNRRYLTRFDMPTEQFSDMLKPGGLQGSLEGVLAQLNPMLKGPLEYATGKQFFTGRDLEDLHSLSGNTLVDQAMMNLPIARAITTVRTLADERKWQEPWTLPLNLLTGIKVTDVDLPKYRAIAEREYIEKMLRGQPNIGKFETLAIHPEAIGTMTNEQLEVARLQKLLEERGRQEAVKKRQIRIQ